MNRQVVPGLDIFSLPFFLFEDYCNLPPPLEDSSQFQRCLHQMMWKICEICLVYYNILLFGKA